MVKVHGVAHRLELALVRHSRGHSGSDVTDDVSAKMRGYLKILKTPKFAFYVAAYLDRGAVTTLTFIPSRRLADIISVCQCGGSSNLTQGSLGRSRTSCP